MVINQQLHDACFAYLQASLRFLGTQPMPFYLFRAINFNRAGNGHSSYDVPKPDFWDFIIGNQATLAALPELGSLYKIVESDPNLSSVLIPNVQSHPDEYRPMQLQNGYMQLFLSEYLEQVGSVNLDTSIFLFVYEEFEQYIYLYNTIVVHWLIQFRNLETEVDLIDLEPRIRMRRSTDDERARAARSDQSLLSPMSFSDYRRNLGTTLYRPDFHAVPEMFLEVDEQRTARNSPIAIPYDTAKRAIRALRLIAPNLVDGHSFWQVKTNPFDSILPRQTYDDVPERTFFGASPYVLTAEFASQLQALWPNVTRVVSDSRLALAFRKFDDSYRRDRSDDRLIDYWIALEALFLGVREGELRFRAALFISRYVTEGGSRDDRSRLFDEMKKSYDLRSAIVHGGAEIETRGKKTKSIDLDETSQRTGDVLRWILREFVEQGRVPSQDAIQSRLME